MTMTAHQVLLKAGYNFEISYSTSAARVNKVCSMGQSELGIL